MRYLIVILAVAVLLFPLTAGATEIPGGPVYGDWFASGNPYNVNGEITVPFDSTLNIHEGVEVIFQGHYKFLVYGFLEAVGTESDSVLFTAADTSVGWHSIRFIDAPDNSHLSYCIIQYGKATGVDPDSWGGGIYCKASSPVISHCTIRRNWAAYVGGLSFLYSSNPTISYSVIAENSADTNCGGIACVWGANMTISHCTVSGNSAGRYEGGIVVYEATATIENCTVVGNTAGWGGGGILVWVATATIENCTVSGNVAGTYGGGIYCYYSNPTISNNSVSENSAGAAGGGIFCEYYSSPEIINNTISGNSAASGGGVSFYQCSGAISHNTISGNSASAGGGIFCANSSSPEIINNTISGNSAVYYGGGIYCGNYSSPTITNTIFWGDTAPTDPEICAVSGSDPVVTYCDVQGGWPGTGNIDADPIFAGPYNEDFYLRWHSPCIDAGDPDPSYNDPDGTRNDMGAFYFNQDVDGIVEVYPLGEPIVIPPEGGDIIYDGWVFNFFGHPGRADIWTYAFVPEMGQYGPLSLYENVRIPADSLGMNGITEHVPGAAPEGDYVFVAYVGEYPGTIIDSSCFYFTKTGSIAGGIADWQTLKGWFDGGLASTGSGLPTHYALSQNYPNPFNAKTVIAYQLPITGRVKLEVYNTLGQEVATVVDERQEAGYKSAAWDASSLSSGLYFYKLSAGDYTETKRMMLVK